MIRRLLVPNRGEIAARIVRTCHRLGIEAVVAASDADLDGLAARVADRTVRLGPAAPNASYLDVEAVVRAARQVGADAVHPGYGFLSENPRLARACTDAGVLFVGPDASHLAAFGDKLAARRAAVEAGVPVVDGGAADDLAAARRLATDLGTPLLVKAAGGGGGRGMQPVHDLADLEVALERATAEAEAAFGDPRVYLERFVAAGRHVEVQILGDGGRVVHLGERDCSVQRRYQKLVEESPAPALSEEVRDRMRVAAVALGEFLGYRGAGTVEFLVDQERGSFHFLEVNARLQVEHPVTEAVTGTDLVAAQLAVAEGRPLSFTQDDVALDGHAIECRINAEDPEHGFAPSPGRVEDAWFPVGPGIRVDAGVQAGSEVVPHYDSLVAKLIVHGTDREQTLQRLAAALRRVELRGVATTVPLLRDVVTDDAFVAGGVTTTWLAELLERRARGVAVAAEVR